MSGPGARLAAIALLLLLAACDEVLAPQAKYLPERPGTVDRAMCLLGFTAVPLREAISGHHLVEVTLNGKPATFVLDTGANATVLHAPFAAEFGLETGGASPGVAVGLGGTMSVGQAPVDEMRVGPVKVRQRRIATADLSQLVKILGTISNRQISGIVGQDLMKRHHAVIDVAKPILYLAPESGERTPVSAERCGAAAEPPAKGP